MFLREIKQAVGGETAGSTPGEPGEPGGPGGARGTGEEVQMPEISDLFAFRPEKTEHLARFTQAVMRGPSELSPGQRELIAAFTSDRNGCPF